MTRDEAILAAGKAVAQAPLNMTIEVFHQRIPSLVVQRDDDYATMTVQQWRDSHDKPRIVLILATSDAFGG